MSEAGERSLPRVAFAAAAEAELVAAARYYEQRATGLGTDFLTLVERTATAVGEAPALGAPYARGTRRRLVPRFPYALVYRETAGRIEILAVMHLRRHPQYWQRRL